MRFFVDTADFSEIEALSKTGLLEGVTTNPTLVFKSGHNFKELLSKICAIVPGPVSAEVAGVDEKTMISEGLELSRIAPNIVIKLPLTWPGLLACQFFAREGISVNMTLCFDVNQALLAAKAGATFISPFIGRLDDVGADGVSLVRDIRHLYTLHRFPTQILAASIRSVHHVRQVALLGADAVTAPPQIFRELVFHPLTEKALQIFQEDWGKTKQSIL